MTNTRSNNEDSAHVRQNCMQDPLRPKAAPPALHAVPPSILLTLRGTVGSGSYLEQGSESELGLGLKCQRRASITQQSVDQQITNSSQELAKGQVLQSASRLRRRPRMHFSVPRLVDHSMVLSRQPRHPSRKACPTKAVCVPRPGLVIMPREVLVSKGSARFLYEPLRNMSPALPG